MSGLVDPADPIRLVDTAPIPACTYTRAGDNQTLAGAEHFGTVKSRGARLFGWRLYLTTTSALVSDDWQLAPAAENTCRQSITSLLRRLCRKLQSASQERLRSRMVSVAHGRKGCIDALFDRRGNKAPGAFCAEYILR